MMTEIAKPAWNEEFRTMDFRRPDGQGQLTNGETLQSAVVVCRERGTATEPVAAMVSDVSVYNQTAVLYKLKAGTAGKSYLLEFQVVTTNGQKLSETVLLKVT